MFLYGILDRALPWLGLKCGAQVAVKIHAQDEQALDMVFNMGCYNRELLFYKEIKDKIPLVTPKALAIWTDGKPLDEEGTNVRFFCLMMDDLVAAGWEPFGVVDPPEMDQLITMVPSLVTLHSTFWEDPIIKQMPISLIPGGHVGNPMFDMIAPMLHTMLPGFIETISAKFGWDEGWPEELKAFTTFAKWLAEDDSKRMIQLTEKYVAIQDEERPHTLCHCDFNAGNCWRPKAGAKQSNSGFRFSDFRGCQSFRRRTTRLPRIYNCAIHMAT